MGLGRSRAAEYPRTSVCPERGHDSTKRATGKLLCKRTIYIAYPPRAAQAPPYHSKRENLRSVTLRCGGGRGGGPFEDRRATWQGGNHVVAGGSRRSPCNDGYCGGFSRPNLKMRALKTPIPYTCPERGRRRFPKVGQPDSTRNPMVVPSGWGRAAGSSSWVRTSRADDGRCRLHGRVRTRDPGGFWGFPDPCRGGEPIPREEPVSIIMIGA